MQRGPRRRRRQTAGTDHGVTYGEGADKDVAEHAQVEVKQILREAYKLAQSTKEKLARKKAHSLAQLGQGKEGIAEAPAGSHRALAASDEHAFFLIDRRKKHEIAVRDHPNKMRYWLEFVNFEETVAKDLHRCRDVFRRAMEHLTGNSDVIMHRVAFEERLGNVDEAINVCVRGLTRFPKEDRLYYKFALLQEADGNILENPFEQWLSRVSPVCDNIDDIGVPPLESFRCPIHESVPHAAFEHAVEWVLRNKQGKLAREVEAQCKGHTVIENDKSAFPTITAVRNLCQRYVCTFNDSTSWTYYARIEAEALRDTERADTVFIAGIHSVPTTMDGQPPYKGESPLMRLRLFLEFVQAVTRGDRYLKHRELLMRLWNACFSANEAKASAEEVDADLSECILRKLRGNLMFSVENADAYALQAADALPLSEGEEKCYLRACDALLNAEYMRISSDGAPFIAKLESDRMRTQFVHRVDRTMQLAKALIRDEWLAVDLVAESVVQRMPDEANVFAIATEMLETHDCAEITMENVSIVTDVLEKVLEFAATVNALVLRALQGQRANHHALTVHFIAFLQNQQDFVLFLSGYFEQMPELAALRQEMCASFLAVLMELNALFEAKCKSTSRSKRAKVADRQLFHPSVIALAQPIWVYLAGLDLSADKLPAVRKLLGASIGKACATRTIFSLEKSMDGIQDVQALFSANPTLCPSAYQNTLEVLNGIFRVYLANEVECGDATRVPTIASNWMQKVFEMASKDMKSLEALQKKVAAEGSLHSKADENKKALQLLFMHFCVNECMWEPWTMEFSENAAEPRETSSESAKMFFSLVEAIQRAHTAVFADESAPAHPSDLLSDISSWMLGRASMDIEALLQPSLTHLWESFAALTSLIAEAPCALCAMGMSAVSAPTELPQIQKVGSSIFGDGQMESSKSRLLQGNLLSPSTPDWAVIHDKLSSEFHDSASQEKCVEYITQRINTLIRMLTAATVAVNCRQGSNALDIPQSAQFFVHQRSSRKAANEAQCEPMSFACGYIPNNIKHLSTELAVYAKSVLTNMQPTADDASKWFAFLETILSAVQFVLLLAKHSSFDPTDAHRLNVNMGNVLKLSLDDNQDFMGNDADSNVVTIDMLQKAYASPSVTIEAAQHKDTTQIETLVGKCILPLHACAMYIRSVQPNLDDRFDDGLNAMQYVLVNVCQSYVQTMLKWGIEDLQTWVDALEALCAAESLAMGPPVEPADKPKMFKLFEIAEETM